MVSVNLVLGELGRSAMENIVEGSTLHAIKPGRILVRQHDAADATYVILHGEGKVFLSEDENETSIAEVGRGDVVGEMGVILNQPRMATIRATTRMQVVRIDRNVLLEALDEVPNVGAHIRKLIEDRIARNQARLGGKLSGQ
ncbi:MAG: cyclic nucleotide-binding domain-containing protein [Alphaproteobacteria bacterium]|nr:cyclic nucleotide-binding domain-containing protein [Alphaproteobacteria bacterium]MBT4546227.1 cyclic nucleotide-binding domain-containing protein [Alphaproteobacteria bacterium]MBT7747745.1 cyclic nucleotide-binding domain-containing protein [Alphaproteobacteria bacterium]